MTEDEMVGWHHQLNGSTKRPEAWPLRTSMTRMLLLLPALLNPAIDTPVLSSNRAARRNLMLPLCALSGASLCGGRRKAVRDRRALQGDFTPPMRPSMPTLQLTQPPGNH